METIDLSKLTPEQMKELQAQLEEKKKADDAKRKADQETYKILVEEAVKTTVKELENLSSCMQEAKKKVFDRFATIIRMKEDLYKVKLNRNSDTFTSEDGQYSISLGRRMNDGWDDSVEVGIAKVKDYLNSLATDEKTAQLVATILELLSRNNKGALKANKILQLQKLADKTDDPLFKEGVKIIQDAYRPIPTVQFIQVKRKTEKGDEILPLSLSAMQ